MIKRCWFFFGEKERKREELQIIYMTRWLIKLWLLRSSNEKRTSLFIVFFFFCLIINILFAKLNFKH